jgi:hypothetical protein
MLGGTSESGHLPDMLFAFALISPILPSKVFSRKYYTKRTY